jgi:hypothetical protein
MCDTDADCVRASCVAGACAGVLEPDESPPDHGCACSHGNTTLGLWSLAGNGLLGLRLLRRRR